MADNAPANPPTDIGKLPEEENGEHIEGVLPQGEGEHHTPVDFDTLIDKSMAELQEKNATAGQTDEEKEAAAAKLQKEREDAEAAEAQKQKDKDEAARVAALENETDEQKQARLAKEKEEADKKIAADLAKGNQTDDAKKGRDADLDRLDADVGEHVKPTTRKIIDSFKTNAKKARDEAEAARQEAAQLKADLEAARKGGLPKEAEAELSQLRDRIREVDALQDPAIVTKYQAPIQKNTTFIVDTLIKAGLTPEQAEVLKKRGLTIGNTKALIDSIETGRGPDTVDATGKKVPGKQYTPDPDTADALREALRDNLRLAKARDGEIETWKAGHEARVKEREAQTKVQVEATNKRASDELGKVVSQFDFLQKPKEPDPSDPPAIKKQKLDAIAAHNDSVNRFAAAIKAETATVDGAFVFARVGILLRDIVVPGLQKRLQDQTKKLAEAEAELGKLKKAGAMSRTVSPAPKPPKDGEGDTDAPVDDDDPFGKALDQAAEKVFAKTQ